MSDYEDLQELIRPYCWAGSVRGNWPGGIPRFPMDPITVTLEQVVIKPEEGFGLDGPFKISEQIGFDYRRMLLLQSERLLDALFRANWVPVGGPVVQEFTTSLTAPVMTLDDRVFREPEQYLVELKLTVEVRKCQGQV